MSASPSQNARFTVSKSKAGIFSHPSINTVINEKGETWFDLKDALLSMNGRPVDILDMFKNDPDMIQTLLELESKWDEIKQSKLPPALCSVCQLPVSTRLRCSACIKERIEVIYCSKQCQKDGWKEHKRVCKLRK